MTKERSLKITVAVVWALVVLFLIGFGLKLLNDFILSPQESISLRLPQPSRGGESREIKVFFADESASRLLSEKRFANLGAGVALDAAALISELMRGPQAEGFFPTIPAETRLLDTYRIGDILVLDFTREIQTYHTGGTASEMLTVYSIVNTATENLDGIKKVQILVEGKEVETLAGHLDLSKPLLPNVKWMSALRCNDGEDPGNAGKVRESGAADTVGNPLSTTARRIAA